MRHLRKTLVSQSPLLLLQVREKRWRLIVPSFFIFSWRTKQGLMIILLAHMPGTDKADLGLG